MRNPGDAYFLMAGVEVRLQQSCNPFVADS